MKKKTFLKELYQDIKIVAAILIIWAILLLLLPMEDYFGEKILSLLGWMINITTFGYVGYSAIKKKNDILYAIKEGAYLGAIIGFVSAALGIISIYMYPEKTQEIIQSAIQNGADPIKAMLFIKISAFSNLIFIPLFSAAIGAILTWIPAMIFKKK